MRFLPFIPMAILMGACTQRQAQPDYPEAPCDSTVYEVFGMTVADPYRPLENDTAEATLEWVKAENDLTRRYLDAIPFRSALHDRLDTLNRYARRGAPWKGEDGKFYWSANDGSHNQAIIYRADTPDGEGEVFLDPNSLSDDGTVALTGLFQSNNGKYTAYTISRSGSDWTEIYVMDTATRELLPDHIEWAKFTGASWDADGFYYSAYARPEAGKEFSNANEFHKVYYHRLGTPQSDDKVAYENPDQPLYFHSAEASKDGRMLAISAGGQGVGESVMVKDLSKGGSKWTVIEPSQDFTNAIVSMKDGKVYLFTSVDAPRNRFVMVDPAKPTRDNWTEIIPEDPDGGVLTEVHFAGDDHIIAVFDRDASNHAYVYDLSGKLLNEIALPTYGTAGAAGADLYACVDAPVTIRPGETVFIPTGIALEVPEGCAGLVYARSGLACKRGLAPANKVGVVDSDYRGEINVVLHNHGSAPQTIDNGERVAQLLITPVLQPASEIAEALTDTDRNAGGFGSTGK